MKKIFGYCRVSSNSQNLSRQLEELKKQGIDDRDIFCDKQSGKDFNREQYILLKKMVRSGDCIIVTELDRFGRNMNEIKEELHYFTQNEVEVKILDLPLLSGTGLETKFINGIFQDNDIINSNTSYYNLTPLFNNKGVDYSKVNFSGEIIVEIENDEIINRLHETLINFDNANNIYVYTDCIDCEPEIELVNEDRHFIKKSLEILCKKLSFLQWC